jgi:hypothetical protein
MADMKWPIRTALLAALAIEAVNFWLLAPPIDVGYPPDTPWYINVLGLQWVILHLPGLRSLDWFERVSGCRQLNLVMGCRRVDTWVLFVSGYLATALLIITLIFAYRWIPRLSDRYFAGRN